LRFMGFVNAVCGFQFKYNCVIYYDVCKILAYSHVFIVYGDRALPFYLKMIFSKFIHKGIFINLF